MKQEDLIGRVITLPDEPDDHVGIILHATKHGVNLFKATVLQWNGNVAIIKFYWNSGRIDPIEWNEYLIKDNLQKLNNKQYETKI